MSKRLTVILVTVLALMLAGIAFAVSRLYSTDQGNNNSRSFDAGARWQVLRAVPSDAALVFVFDGSRAAKKVIADSTGLLRPFISPDSPALMTFLSAVADMPMAVSLHNSGALVPLVALQLQRADSAAVAALCTLAADSGLKTDVKNGFLLASRSETYIQASVRHLDDDFSVLGNPGLADLLPNVSGSAVALASHALSGKLLGIYASAGVRARAAFVKDLAAWTAFVIEDASDSKVRLNACALPGTAPGSYLAAVAGQSATQAQFPEALPYFTDYALSIPVSSIDATLAGLRTYRDGLGQLARYNRELSSRHSLELSPEEWMRDIQMKEAVKASFTGDNGITRTVYLVRTGRDLHLGEGSRNVYRGYLEAIFGSSFSSVTDTSCASINSHWSVYGDGPSIKAYQNAEFLRYSLKDRLSDASVSVPSGFVTYASLTDYPQAGAEVFSSRPAETLSAYVQGSGFAPAFISLDPSGRVARFSISLEKQALKGSRVQVLERDSTVVIPTGPFPVRNHSTGQTNYLYQNSNMYICLNDENGRGVWGIPFSTPICGAVESIDYYNNGKIQYLFASDDKLYLLDRLGHWVNGFPVSLPKAVLLGPAAFDFTGAHGYRVMVLHTDNSLEMYNLHGERAEGWNGINAPETVKSLPELLELNGHRYWVVRTSVRTLIYPFGGGEALTTEDGGRMLRPDTPITPTSRGVSVQCYDGRTRDIRLN